MPSSELAELGWMFFRRFLALKNRPKLHENDEGKKSQV